MIHMNYDHGFRPAILELRKFEEDVKASGHAVPLSIAVERNGGYVYRKDLLVFEDGIDDERNILVAERIIKTILWVVGGYRIFVAGSHRIYEAIHAAYQPGGLREFDYGFMSTVYDHPVEVIEADEGTIPAAKESSIPNGGHLKGRRIGFDAGGSDRKVSAVIDGKVVYSEETVWFPKLNSDPHYHIDGIYAAMKTGIEKLGGDVDAIGISSAGVFVENKAMVVSLFLKVGKEDYAKYVKNIYGDIVHRLEEELGHPIPFAVSNDGDVTALAGSLDLHSGEVLGIAMGTSEAVGYVNSEGNLNGWLSELAFAPVDFNEDSLRDEWSGDYGVGCKYFSQDAVIKLAGMAGIELDASLSLAEKLKYVQKLNAEGDERASRIFEDIGTYLGYELAYYAEFYKIKHVLLLGRVTSGKGGDTILEVAKKTLDEAFPEYRDIQIGMPSEYVRRVGQSIAAASLPEAE